MKVFSVAEMVAAEKEASEQGHSYEQMMEQAGRGVAEAIASEYDVRNKRILVLVGPGNNGGDGLVAGHYLAQAGAAVAFYLYKPRTAVDDANFARLEEQNLPIFTANFDQRYRVLRLRLNGCDIVLDALLGTGVSRPIQGEMAQLLRQVRAGLDERAQIMAQEAGLINESGLTQVANITAVFSSPKPPHPQVIAVDCPSGLHCDSGEIDPLALPADLTVTFGGPKRGHFLFPGAGACGQLITAEIGLNPRHDSVKNVRVRVALADDIGATMPPRPADGHKGTFGRVLIAAGSSQYRGAPVLSGRGALRAGAGLVAIATPQVVRHTAVSQLPEATYPPLSAVDRLDDTAVDEIETDAYKAALVGPGLDNADAFLVRFLSTLSAKNDPALPLVIDADGLNILAQQENWPHLLPPQTILTPHPGEMARLLGQPLSEVLAANRFDLALENAAVWGCVVVLKGAYTVVAAPHKKLGSVATVIPFATPLLGTAGSGDVLAGVIVTLLAQGLSPYDAAVVGAYWHGRAGDYLTRQMGNGGALASEIADALPYTRP